MDRLDAINLFLRVVERGSFSSAGKEVGIGQSAVSKKIASLEARLGAQLLNRSSRSLSLTESGQLFTKERCDWQKISQHWNLA